MRDLAIKRIMTECPATLAPGNRLSEARKLFTSRGIHHLPVLDDGRLVGILSASDLLNLELLERARISLADVEVRHVMHANPVTINVGASLRDAAAKLRAGEFHALPVVDDDSVLIGIVTTTNLIETLLRQLPTGDGSLDEPGNNMQKLAERNRLLTAACQAAELYIRSGNASHEHSVLVKRLADLRASESVNL